MNARSCHRSSFGCQRGLGSRSADSVKVGGRSLGWISVVVILGACVVPPGSSLGVPEPFTERVPQRAWIAPVEIEGADAQAAEAAAALTLSLRRYLDEAQVFREVMLLPGDVAAGELVLRLHFERYQERRGPHPAYFPAALLTLTLYIWAGGPIYRDSSEFEASLEVLDGSGSVRAKASSGLKETSNVSLFDFEYVFPSGLESRTRIVRELLDDVLAQIAEGAGQAL